MSVSESIVREFFELHGFLVRQCRKYVAPHAPDDDIDFLVLNPRPAPGADIASLPFELGPADLPRLRAAVVVVRGWHTETFSPARLSGAPELLRFVEPAIFQQAVRAFGGGHAPAKILVVPALPQTAALRREAVEMLRSRGVDAVLAFRTALADLIERVEPNRNYQKSDLLQTLRLLKRYEFLRSPQLELFRPPRRRSAKAAADSTPA